MSVQAGAHRYHGTSPRIDGLLEREGLVVNHKRVHRIYRTAGLQVRGRRRKRLTRAERIPLPVPDQRLDRWSMDLHGSNTTAR